MDKREIVLISDTSVSDLIEEKHVGTEGTCCEMQDNDNLVLQKEIIWSTQL